MKTRLLAIGALAALTAGLLATPASAAGTTRYVDDDGTAGARGCRGATTVPTTIGGALAEASPGDTILVCPGRYPERVTIGVKGVTVRAVQRWKAVVIPRTSTSDPLVQVTAPNVTVQWLKVVARTTGTCDRVESGVQVAGASGARIISNQVRSASNGDTLYGACGMSSGIAVTDGATDVLVAHNVVRDFELVGVTVYLAEARVIDNSLQFWHEGETCPTRLADCLLRRPAELLPPTGVNVYQGTATIALNATSIGPDGTATLPYLSYGVNVEGTDGVRIRDNSIRHAALGVAINDLAGARVTGNVIVGIGVGPVRSATPAAGAPGLVAWDVTDSRFRENHVLGFQFGIVMGTGAAGNLIEGNDATGNDIDCRDVPELAGDTVDVNNTWTDNLGNDDDPVGLCTDGPVQAEPGSPT